MHHPLVIFLIFLYFSITAAKIVEQFYNQKDIFKQHLLYFFPNNFFLRKYELENRISLSYAKMHNFYRTFDHIFHFHFLTSLTDKVV